jgi:hypothetical protein
METIKRIVGLLLASLFTLSLTACGKANYLTLDFNEKRGGVDIVAQGAPNGSAVTGHLTVGEGECLAINLSLQSGSFDVWIIAGNQDVPGPDDGHEVMISSFFNVIELEPGEYTLNISVRNRIAGETTTGKLILLPCRSDELDSIAEKNQP